MRSDYTLPESKGAMTRTARINVNIYPGTILGSSIDRIRFWFLSCSVSFGLLVRICKLHDVMLLSLKGKHVLIGPARVLIPPVAVVFYCISFAREA